MSPRTAKQNDQIRRERARQILDAALTVYVRRGYVSAEIEDVAQEAGLARGLVYYYYKSKQALFQALFEWVFEQTQARMQQLFVENGETSPLGRLVHFARELCFSTFRDPRLAQFYMRVPQDAERVLGTQVVGPDQKWMGEVEGQVLEVLIQAMDKGEIRPGNARLAANAFWGGLLMNLGELIHIPLPAGQTVTAKEDIVEEILAYCFEGLGDCRKRWRQIKGNCHEDFTSKDET
jgi:TetR/AcrR family transcriptional regulator